MLATSLHFHSNCTDARQRSFVSEPMSMLTRLYSSEVQPNSQISLDSISATYVSSHSRAICLELVVTSQLQTKAVLRQPYFRAEIRALLSPGPRTALCRSLFQVLIHPVKCYIPLPFLLSLKNSTMPWNIFNEKKCYKWVQLEK